MNLYLVSRHPLTCIDNSNVHNITLSLHCYNMDSLQASKKQSPFLYLNLLWRSWFFWSYLKLLFMGYVFYIYMDVLVMTLYRNNRSEFAFWLFSSNHSRKIKNTSKYCANLALLMKSHVKFRTIDEHRNVFTMVHQLLGQ